MVDQFKRYTFIKRGVFYYSRRVPSELQTIYSKVRVTTCLHTKVEAKANRAAASQDAKALLLKDDAEWQRLRPLMKVKNDAEFEALKIGFRAGIPTLKTTDQAAAARLFTLLAQYGGQDLTGENPILASGTFAPNDGLF